VPILKTLNVSLGTVVSALGFDLKKPAKNVFNFDILSTLSRLVSLRVARMRLNLAFQTGVTVRGSWYE
jgi:hypothetical protein